MIKVNRKQARKQYNNGGTVYVLPCKTRFENAWILPLKMSRKLLLNDEFDTVVNCYEYYNCNSETGKYAAFYTEG